MKKPRWKRDFCKECGNRLENGECGICKKFEDRDAEPAPPEVTAGSIMAEIVAETLDRLKWDIPSMRCSAPHNPPPGASEPLPLNPPGARIFYFKGQVRYGCPNCAWDTYQPQLYVQHVKWNHNGGRE